MKQLLVVVTLLFLAACGGIPQGATPQPTDVPLLTDEDFDNAQLLLPTEVKELVGIEGGEATAEPMLTVPSNAVLSQQTTQTGVLDPYSRFSYIEVDSSPTNAPDVRSIAPTTYRIFLKEIGSNSPWLIYSGAREVQSISSMHHKWIYISMRETTSPTSDFEIFVIDFSESQQIRQLTFDDVDNINVSGIGVEHLFVYEEIISGKSTIVLATKEGGQIFTLRLSSPYSQRHPSFSGDSTQIVFVRNLSNGYDSIMKYTAYNNTYSTLVDTTPTNARTSTPVTLDFPSLSYNGNKVLWLENNNTVKLKDLSTGSVRIVASDPTIKRPHLSKTRGVDWDSGMYMTYQQGRNVFYKNLQTAQVWAITNHPGFGYVSSYGAVPDLYLAEPALQVTVTGLPSGQNRVKLINPYSQVVATFGSSRTFDYRDRYFGDGGTYTITAESFSTGLPTKPTCKTYTPTIASQTVTLNYGDVKRVSVTYTNEPCNP
jgi:hypothetical protein